MTDQFEHCQGEDRTDLGDQFLKLFLKHQLQLYSYIISLVPNVNDAQDIFQETTTVMWKKFPSFETGTNFIAWSTRIAHLNVLQYYRKQHNQKLVFDSDTLESVMGTMMQRIDRTHDHIDALKQCVDGLPADQKYVVKLKYEKRIPIRDIAIQVDRTASSVYKTLTRIHLRLQRRIQMRLAAWELNRE